MENKFFISSTAGFSSTVDRKNVEKQTNKDISRKKLCAQSFELIKNNLEVRQKPQKGLD